jgi:5-formyltetrahydrofolate cyclo-ligase
MKKTDLRKKYKTLRAAFTNAEREALSEKIVQNLLNNFDIEHKKVSVFVPLTRFHEINTWLLVDAVKADFALPVIGKNDELVHLRYEGKDQLKMSPFGVLEPQFGEEVMPQDFDLVIVPLLTIDRNGYRVGYGKGYYDKFLARCKSSCRFIGLYQFDVIEEIDDLYDSDIALHHCVTPYGVLDFGR